MMVMGGGNTVGTISYQALRGVDELRCTLSMDEDAVSLAGRSLHFVDAVLVGEVGAFGLYPSDLPDLTSVGGVGTEETYVSR